MEPEHGQDSNIRNLPLNCILSLSKPSGSIGNSVDGIYPWAISLTPTTFCLLPWRFSFFFFFMMTYCTTNVWHCNIVPIDSFSITNIWQGATDLKSPGGVRHDPQRFTGKTVSVPHFNRDTVEFASRKRNESNPGIKTLLPFPKNITEESDFENFQDLIVALDACYWLHKTISRSLSRFGDDRAI